MARRVYDHAWRKVRLVVLERDGGQCQIRGRGCTETATDVDHIVPVDAGGARLDVMNLRAACGHCNRSRASREKHREGWRRSSTRIVVVMGPPAAGKSTYVQEHKAANDLVVDYDRIAEAFGSGVTHGHDAAMHQAVSRARGSVLNALRRGDMPDVSTAWIVTSNPEGATLFPSHEVVTIDPGIDETLRRVEAAGRPRLWVQLVHDWYAAHEPPGPSRSW